MSFGFLEVPKTVESIAWWVAGVLGLSLGVHRFWKSKTKTDNFIEVHTEIHELLTELRLTSKSMRASILCFHNGEYYANGISMRKFSISHESVHRGYTTQVYKLKNVLCSLCIPLLNHVLQDKSNIHSTETASEGYFKQFLEDENISHYACLLLKDKGITIGFILLQWHKDFIPQIEEFGHFDNLFKNYRDSIQLQLEYQKNSK
jgi:hypothetical protein